MSRNAPVRLVVNPTAGKGDAIRWIERVVARGGIDRAAVRIPETVDGLSDAVRCAVGEGVERVVVAGGDGTLHAALPALAGSGATLGLVPIGTGNDFAAELGLPSDPDRALGRALHGAARAIDLGRVERRPFAGTFGVGLDGEVAARVRRGAFKTLGPLAYAACAIAAIARYRPPEAAIEHDHGRFRGRVTFAVLANARRFGGGMRVAPDASLEDGALDLVIVREVGSLELLRALPGIYRGAHVDHPAVTVVRTRRATVACDPPCAGYADGEPVAEVGARPVAVEADAGALRVVRGTD